MIFGGKSLAARTLFILKLSSVEIKLQINWQWKLLELLLQLQYLSVHEKVFFFGKFKLLEIWSKQPLELSLIQILLEVNLPVIVFPTGD